jgi:hypothetical protein
MNESEVTYLKKVVGVLLIIGLTIFVAVVVSRSFLLFIRTVNKYIDLLPTILPFMVELYFVLGWLLTFIGGIALIAAINYLIAHFINWLCNLGLKLKYSYSIFLIEVMFAMLLLHGHIK